jgi:hypothetical protein
VSKRKADKTLSIIKAGISGIPYIGGPLASLIGDAISAPTEESIRRAIELLRNKLRDMKDRIDIDAVKRDEFAELFKSCYLTIVRTHQKEKLNAATSLIANILLKEGDPEKLSYTELDHFVRCLDFLSIGAINVLIHSVKIAENDATSDLASHSYEFAFVNLRERLKDMETSLLMGLVGELNSMNLLYIGGDPQKRKGQLNYGYAIQQTPDERFEEFYIELMPLGTRFVKHFLMSGD